MYKVFFITFGCKVNQYETDSMRSEFVSQGFVETDSADDADIIIINSCTVTGSGDSKSLYSVRKMRKIAPNAIIALTGCLPQAAPEIAAKIPETDIVAGTKDRRKLPELVRSVIAERRHIVAIDQYGAHDEFELMRFEGAQDKTRAFVKIQDGCNQFCSYCIIPYARGRLRSKPIDALKDEVSRLAQSGRREIVLVGINLAFYGVEFGLRLADAVEVCCKTEGIERVRLGSLEPEMLSDEDLRRLAALPELCPQFHLSLQSGSENTLKAMNRKYTAADYFTLTQKIRAAFPNASFTTDIMVGFPTETEEHFAESMRFAEKIGFAKIHVFQYSPRTGTPAAKMPQIAASVKAERADRMKALADRLHSAHLQSLVGKTVAVLFERENSTDFHRGYAPDYTLIKISRKNPQKSLRNQIIRVIIEENRSDYCFGRLESEAAQQE